MTRPLLSIKQMSERLGWSYGRVWRLVAMKAIPHVRMPGTKGPGGKGLIYFEEDQVAAWIEASRVAPVAPREPAEQPLPAGSTPTHAAECEALGVPVNHRYS
ncbi:hypothetical protein BH18ACI5_BH18ACI5_04510 [soil metagenome]